MNQDIILTEKYRPVDFRQILGIPENFERRLGPQMKNMLFIGPPGTGKTTLSKAICKFCDVDVLHINGSDARGIDIVRGDIKTFMQGKSFKGSYRILDLQEADKLTKDAQDALRDLIEKYEQNCKVIMTGNYENKFTHAIKERCEVYKFGNINKEKIFAHLQHIIDNENNDRQATDRYLIQIEQDALQKLIEIHYPSVRVMINELQRFSYADKIITKDDIQPPYKELVKNALNPFFAFYDLPFDQQADDKYNNAWNQSRQVLRESGLSYEELLDCFKQYLLDDHISSTMKKYNLLAQLNEVNKFMNLVVDKELLFALFLSKVGGVIGGK